MQELDKSIPKIDDKISKLPPIFVAGIINIISLTTLLVRIVKNE
jgi:hypothetical protein